VIGRKPELHVCMAGTRVGGTVNPYLQGPPFTLLLTLESSCNQCYAHLYETKFHGSTQ